MKGKTKYFIKEQENEVIRESPSHVNIPSNKNMPSNSSMQSKRHSKNTIKYFQKIFQIDEQLKQIREQSEQIREQSIEYNNAAILKKQKKVEEKVQTFRLQKLLKICESFSFGVVIVLTVYILFVYYPSHDERYLRSQIHLNIDPNQNTTFQESAWVFPFNSGQIQAVIPAKRILHLHRAMDNSLNNLRKYVMLLLLLGLGLFFSCKFMKPVDFSLKQHGIESEFESGQNTIENVRLLMKVLTFGVWLSCGCLMLYDLYVDYDYTVFDGNVQNIPTAGTGIQYMMSKIYSQQLYFYLAMVENSSFQLNATANISYFHYPLYSQALLNRIPNDTFVQKIQSIAKNYSTAEISADSPFFRTFNSSFLSSNMTRQYSNNSKHKESFNKMYATDTISAKTALSQMYYFQALEKYFRCSVDGVNGIFYQNESEMNANGIKYTILLDEVYAVSRYCMEIVNFDSFGTLTAGQQYLILACLLVGIGVLGMMSLLIKWMKATCEKIKLYCYYCCDKGDEDEMFEGKPNKQKDVNREGNKNGNGNGNGNEGKQSNEDGNKDKQNESSFAINLKQNWIDQCQVLK